MENRKNNKIENGNSSSVDRNHLYTSAALQERIIQNLKSGRHPGDNQDGIDSQFTNVQAMIADSGLNPVNRKADRAKMDPIFDNDEPADMMVRKIDNAAYGDRDEDGAPIKKPVRGRQPAQPKDTAEAFLFEDNQMRGFRNTHIDFNQKAKDAVAGRENRHVSPEERGQPIYEQAGKELGRAKSSERIVEGFYHQDRGIRPSRSLGGGGARHAPTYAHKQRIKHLGDPDDYGQRNYEMKIKALKDNQITKSHMSSRVIETWINDTLRDAGHLDIPGVILKPESSTPLNRYGIDKNQLILGQISQEGIDRIYRALFVYSLGFYEMLNKALKNSPMKDAFQNALWKVFSILLEYCCKTNYQMLVKKIQAEHRDELQAQEKEFMDYQERMDESEKLLKLEAGDLKKQNDRLEKELDEELQYSKKLREDMAYQSKNHEEEVQLRLQFESKLNSLHALHRDVKAKYSRAAEDIFQLETFNKEKSDMLEKQKEELIELRSLRIEHESTISLSNEKMKHLMTELEIKIKHISENENKIINLNDIIEKKDYKIKDMDQVFNTLRLKNEASQATINSLQGEKQHLQLSLKENRTLKDQYYEKSETIQQKYQELFERLNLIQKDVVAIDEIKRDRDERLNQLRDELDDIQLIYDELNKNNSSLQVKYKHTKEELDKFKFDFDRLVDNLNKANKIRQETEEALDKKNKDYDLMVQKHEDALKSVDALRKENEKLNGRLQDSEKAFDTLQIKKESLEKQNEIQRSQLNDKIRNLEQLLSFEKDARENWINKFEMEQKGHVNTNTELLGMRSRHQDADMNWKNAQINLDSITDARKSLNEAHDELQIELSNVKAKNENLERELYSKTELLKNVEEQQRFYVRRLKEDYQKIQKQIGVKVHEQQMLFEDLRSFMVIKHEKELQLVEKIDELNKEKDALNERIGQHLLTIDHRNDEIALLQKDIKGHEETVADLRLENVIKDQEVIKSKQNEDKLKVNIYELEVKLEQIPKLEREIQTITASKSEVQRQLDEVNDQLEQMRGDKVDVSIQQVPETAEEGVQTEEDFSQMQGGQNQQMNYDQMNMFQNQNMNQMYQRSDTESLQMMPGYGQPAMGSLSQGGLMQPQMSNLNFSTQNIRQSIQLTAGKNHRIQSAINTGPSQGFIGSNKMGIQMHQNMMGGASTTGFSGMVNSNAGSRTIGAEIDRSRQPGAKSASENRYRGQISGNPQLQTYNGGLGQEMLIDEAQYHQQMLQRPTTGGIHGQNYAQRGGYSINTSGQDSQVPHLFTHQAASKKSFRIRGQAEQEMMKREASESVKDIGMMDFNNDILKSVYELRKSHAALVNRPISSQPFNANNRRNIQSAVARQPQQMAFGGFMIPVGNGEQNQQMLNMATSGDGFLLSDANQILEIDELQSERGKKTKLGKTEKSGRVTIPRPNKSKTTTQPSKMQVGISVNPTNAGVGVKPIQPESATSAARARLNVSSQLHLQGFNNQDMSMSGKSLHNPLHNLTGMYGMRSQADGLTINAGQTLSQEGAGPQTSKSRKKKDAQAKGTIKNLIKMASSND